MSRSGNDFGAAKEHSGWLVPLAVFFVTACLSALVLAYYFAPDASTIGQELPAPTDSPIRVQLSVGANTFRIPSNYLPLASTRRGGAVREVDIAAVVPRFDGFSMGQIDEFTANDPDSPVVYITLKTGVAPLLEQDRLKRIYLPQVENEYGQEGPFGLRLYNFRADTGYHNQELFYAATGPAALICDKLDPITPSPNCLRDLPLGNGLSMHYRFKRSRLEQWQEIDKGVSALIASFKGKT